MSKKSLFAVGLSSAVVTFGILWLSLGKPSCHHGQTSDHTCHRVEQTK